MPRLCTPQAGEPQLCTRRAFLDLRPCVVFPTFQRSLRPCKRLSARLTHHQNMRHAPQAIKSSIIFISKGTYIITTDENDLETETSERRMQSASGRDPAESLLKTVGKSTQQVAGGPYSLVQLCRSEFKVCSYRPSSRLMRSSNVIFVNERYVSGHNESKTCL